MPIFGEEDELTGLLLRTGHGLRRQLGPRGQMRILKILEEKGAISQKELQEALGIQAGSMSEILQKMEERGLILREKDPKDRRRLLLTLTEKGRQRGSEEGRKDLYQQLYQGLSEEERVRLKELLGRLLESWSESGESPDA